MYCANCGSRIENENASFCSSCGIKIGEFKTAQAATANSSKNEGTIYIVLGWMFFAISLLFVPLVFGAGAFIMGYLTYRVRSEIHGVVLMVFAIVGTIFGVLLGIIVWSIE